MSQEIFEKQVEEERELNLVTSWTDLPKSVIYKIILIEEKFSEDHGECFLANIHDNKNESYKIWLPARMIKLILEKREEYKDVYFMSNGQRKISKIKKINDFDIVFENGKKIISDLFQNVSQ